MNTQSKPQMSMRSEPVEYSSQFQQYAPGHAFPTPEYELLSRSQDGDSIKAAAKERRPCCSQSPAWLLEILAISASVGCMIGVVVILAQMKDQPLSTWTVVLNLNSSIAVLITALKSTAMLAVASCISQNKWQFFKRRRARLQQLDTFDEASRGPLGACRLLWSLRCRFDIALVGAVITIVVLGVDTFAQQVIKFEQRVDPVENNGTALFMVTDTYDGGARSREQSNIPTVAKASTVDTAMQGAIYRGLYNTASSQPFNCSSQCVWPSIARSLGFASQCEDVTAKSLATLKHTAFSNGTHSQQDLTPKRFNAGTVYTPEFVRVGILRMRDTITDEHDYWFLGANVTEIFECTVRFTTYEYSDIRTAGSKLAIGNTKETGLGLGYKYDMDTRKNRWFAVFNQTENMSPFTIGTADMGALADFYTTNRFSGSIFDGESPPASSGMGTAFLKGNIPAVFDNMAQSMTDHLRSGYSNVQPVSGNTLVSVTIVRVYWVWLSLPLGVLALAVLLLVATIWTSWDSRGQLWKSSVVAALYHNVAPGTGSGGVLYTDLQGVKHLDKLAEETTLIYS
ncbi:uncharacterized protein PG986_003651 [Apiospora aurea]|uniref:Uncharacterized protein n=1 Tax=Apiospora aurea TaxID=335848 RepID=A0ABR1QSB0_9PEZI